MGCKEQGAEKRVIVIQKEKKQPALFLNNNEPVFALCFSAPHIFYPISLKFQILKQYQVDMIFYISGCRLIG
jgi:hypothetical protein